MQKILSLSFLDYVVGQMFSILWDYLHFTSENSLTSVSSDSPEASGMGNNSFLKIEPENAKRPELLKISLTSFGHLSSFPEQLPGFADSDGLLGLPSLL